MLVVEDGAGCEAINSVSFVRAVHGNRANGAVGPALAELLGRYNRSWRLGSVGMRRGAVVLQRLHRESGASDPGLQWGP